MPNRKVIYVDDEIINLELFSFSIGKHFPVICVESGKKALELLRLNEDIRLVITDMKMPEMNGLELVKEVKQFNASIPCIMLSGYQKTDEIMEALREKIIVEYLMKPFDKNEMIELIRSNIAK